jgi:hypothetical protein
MEMKSGALALVVVGMGLIVPTTVDAQRDWDRGRFPAGLCRVWYDRLPANRQPAPMSCRQAEAIARRDPSARVIYGSNAGRRPQVLPRYPYPGQFPNRRDGWNAAGPAYSVGYKDGYDKGLEDAEDNDRYDPRRHGRFRSGDHGYEREYGSKDQYRIVYREGFMAGYDAGYGDLRTPRRRW